MLTIDEIKNVSFRKATLSGGYRAEDVDAFIDEIIASFEQLKKEKTNLVHKIDRLATRLEEYRADEETVRNALLTSQKMSDACIKEARELSARQRRRQMRSPLRQTTRPLSRRRIISSSRLTQLISEPSSLSFTEATSRLSMTFPHQRISTRPPRSLTRNIPPLP